MTEKKKEPAMPMPDRSGTAEATARPLTEEERALNLPCQVRHPDAGGLCAREARAMVYGLVFCWEHGAEATVGALLELYQDAGDFLERLDNPHVPTQNAEAERALEAALGGLDGWRRSLEREEAEEEAVRRAYPEIPERVCPETAGFDYRFGPGNRYDLSDMPTEVYSDARRITHKLMRLAYEAGEDQLVEVLEYEREQASAQLSFALADYERRVGTPEEREERRRRST